MLGKLDDYLRFQETALALRAQRQEILASNIANADTPNYKARDFDFQGALQDALTKQSSPAGVLATTNARHIPRGTPDGNTLPDGTQLQYRVPTQNTVDGNTVDMDVERAQFADNALRYEAGVTVLNQQIRAMLAAVQGGQ
ncbi:flagellar basal body rod protein FlgB [Massilia agilis]|uniref:Flagellar basal body rod protein FlgB n=1 Tax=Massilia agilis TaxID=1811226 RepID=A0ABT2DAC5_9BURK|nr:flagellar basal body rod protein FlgB [Massilia agilis]MCS0807408.1 flagellar basal body rod protein FlgB [Massilia agilis]